MTTNAQFCVAWGLWAVGALIFAFHGAAAFGFIVFGVAAVQFITAVRR